MKKRKNRKPRKRNRCPDCGARSPECKYYVFKGRGYASENFGGGMRLCKNAFHGVGSWV